MTGSDAAEARAELARLWTGLTGLDGPPPVTFDGGGVPLPGRYRVADGAAVAVGLALAAASRSRAGQVRADDAPAAVRLHRGHAVEVFRAEQRLRVDGARIPVWDALAGDYRAADGWVKLHTNYPHHRAALLAALDLPPDAGRGAVAAAVAPMGRIAVEEAIQRAGGAAGALRTPAQWRAHPQAAAVAARPLLAVDPLGPDGGPAVPAPGRLRVLDLTRVIAAPTTTKALAALGADVLRLDAPGFDEVAGLLPDTTAGKRCARLDLRGRDGLATFDELVRTADVLVCGLRPGALERLGRPPQELLRRRPGLVLAELSAYGDTGPWAGRRGFDSLVQFVTGIASPDPDADPDADPDLDAAPVSLPVQALDHASGWLLAAGILEAVHRQRADGRARRVGVVLARTAAWLDGLGRSDPTVTSEAARDAAGEPGWLEELDSPFGRLRRVRFPGTIGGRTPGWAGPPSPLGCHEPSWPEAGDGGR